MVFGFIRKKIFKDCVTPYDLALASANIECKNFALTLKSTTNEDDEEERKNIDDSIRTNFSSDAQFSSKGMCGVCVLEEI
jgi:hypothetical protein